MSKEEPNHAPRVLAFEYLESKLCLAELVVISTVEFGFTEDGTDTNLYAYVSSSEYEIGWHESAGNLNFGATRGFAVDTDVADLDRDGDIDVRLQDVITIRAGDVVSVCVADLDGDGDLDIIAASFKANGNDEISWYENLGGPDDQDRFGPRRVLGNGWAFSVADLDGDQDLDILAAGSNVLWYENTDGNGNFVEHFITYSIYGPTTVYATDIDNDGDMDAVAGIVDAGIVWFENTDGQGAFRASQWIASGQVIDVADMDSDGGTDIVTVESTHDGATTIQWLENCDGLGTFGQNQFVAQATATAISVTDLDRDGDVDVVSAGDDDITLYENTDGGGTFGSPQTIATDVGYVGFLKAADLDGDGDVDLLTVSDQEFVDGGTKTTPDFTQVPDNTQSSFSDAIVVVPPGAGKGARPSDSPTLPSNSEGYDPRLDDSAKSESVSSGAETTEFQRRQCDDVGCNPDGANTPPDPNDVFNMFAMPTEDAENAGTSSSDAAPFVQTPQDVINSEGTSPETTEELVRDGDVREPGQRGGEDESLGSNENADGKLESESQQLNTPAGDENASNSSAADERVGEVVEPTVGSHAVLVMPDALQLDEPTTSDASVLSDSVSNAPVSTEQGASVTVASGALSAGETQDSRLPETIGQAFSWTPTGMFAGIAAVGGLVLAGIRRWRRRAEGSKTASESSPTSQMEKSSTLPKKSSLTTHTDRSESSMPRGAKAGHLVRRDDHREKRRPRYGKKPFAAPATISRDKATKGGPWR